MADTPPSTFPAVDAFLDAVCLGTGIPVGLYAEDAVLDATVPNWRFVVTGGAAISEEYGRWFAAPAVLEELTRRPFDGGEMVRYMLSWVENETPHAAHHCHSLTMGEKGEIISDVVFCGGRWDAALLARMGEQAL